MLRFCVPLFFSLLVMCCSTFATSVAPSKDGVLIYTMPNCLGCSLVKSMFDSQEIPYVEINVVEDRVAYERMKEITGKKTVPRVFINGEYIGGYSEVSSVDLKMLVNKNKPSSQN